ncbi:MAG: hypothetical protein Q8900_07280 [Bacillota bacterium]|nr:hypothetical protein [Bacillota bacterium]
MKKALNILVWLSVTCTIFTLMLTLLTTYYFNYHFNNFCFKFFNGYSTLQWCIFFTMILLGIRLFSYKDNMKSSTYSYVCFFMAACAMVFLVIGVS